MSNFFQTSSHAVATYSRSRGRRRSLTLTHALREPFPSSPDEKELLAQFTEATGAAPGHEDREWLRCLQDLYWTADSEHFSLDARALAGLLPCGRQPADHALDPCADPFRIKDYPRAHDLWARFPSSPLELWAHLAVFLREVCIPLPPFSELLTAFVASKTKEILPYRRERQIHDCRRLFARLAVVLAAQQEGGALPGVRKIRLRLTVRGGVWETSTGSGFVPITDEDLNKLVENFESLAREFTLHTLNLVSRLHLRLERGDSVELSFTEDEDRAFVGQILSDPLCRDCVVSGAGDPLRYSPNRISWAFRDHPSAPDLAIVELVTADGSPPPAGLLHLGGTPAHYLLGAEILTGPPPPGTSGSSTVVPRAALSFPEAAEFAARAGMALPVSTTAPLRHESLRARMRGRIDRPGRKDEVVVVELAAVNAEGTPRAIYEDKFWRRSGAGIPPISAEEGPLSLDLAPLSEAAEHFTEFEYWDFEEDHPNGPRYTCDSNDSSFPENFADWIEGFPPDTLIELEGQLATLAQPATPATLTVDLQPVDGSIDWFDLRLTLHVGDRTFTSKEIALLEEAEGGFVRIKNRGWRRLAITEEPGLQDQLDRLGLDSDSVSNLTPGQLRFHALQLTDLIYSNLLGASNWASLRARSDSLRAVPPPAVPPGFVGELRPYQLEGFQFLAFLAENGLGGILADDMGLGKTVQALVWLLSLANRPRKPGVPFRVLIVCPRSVVVNWQLEAQRFTPELAATAFTPQHFARAAKEASPPEIVVATYAQLRLHREVLASIKWDAVILDEGQIIKNPATATARAARALKATHRLVLTGTPVENRLLDLWSLYAFAQPGLLGRSPDEFEKLYGDRRDSADARQSVAQRVKHFQLRRTKLQVARELPPRIEKDLIVDLAPAQRRLYDAELHRARELLRELSEPKGAGDSTSKKRFNILAALLRLRQICCDPRLLGLTEKEVLALGRKPKARRTDEVESPASSGAAMSAKMEALLHTLEPIIAEGHKILIFSQFVRMLELISNELVKRDVGHLMLTGKTENRQELVDRFQAERTAPVFLISLKAGGTGLNLTAASYVMLYDPWWNPAVEAQAIDRTHRIGQPNQVIAYRLIARDTVEEKIRLLQQHKGELAATVVQEEQLANVLDLEALRQILS